MIWLNEFLALLLLWLFNPINVELNASRIKFNKSFLIFYFLIKSLERVSILIDLIILITRYKSFLGESFLKTLINLSLKLNISIFNIIFRLRDWVTINININIIISIITSSLILLTILFKMIFSRFYKLLPDVNYILIIISFFFYIINSISHYRLKIEIINNINFKKRDNDETLRVKIFIFLKSSNFFLIRNVKSLAIIFNISLFIFYNMNNILYIYNIYLRIKRILRDSLYNYSCNNCRCIFYIFIIDCIAF